jgi:hypothetical protein
MPTAKTPKKIKAPEYTSKQLTDYAKKFLTLKGFKVWNNTSAGIVGGGRFVSVAKGIPDITGFRLSDALFIGVEIKTKTDKLSEHQIEFMELLVKAGGIWCEMRSPKDIEDLFKM